ncbi:MAG: hypothetical protein EOP84_03455, partial [Verrucomicrobiaceae bacterium]
MTALVSHIAKGIAVCSVLASMSLSASAQPRLTAGTPAGGLIPLTLGTRPGYLYHWESSAALDEWAPLPLATAATVPLLATGTTMGLSAPSGSGKGFYRVKESSPFFPAWADVRPLRTIQHAFNPLITSSANGTALRNAMYALVPGDRLEIATGNYQLTGAVSLNLQGTAQAPI